MPRARRRCWSRKTVICRTLPPSGAKRNAGNAGDLPADGEVSQIANLFGSERVVRDGEQADRQA